MSIWTKSPSIERTLPRAISPSLKDRALTRAEHVEAKLSPAPASGAVSVAVGCTVVSDMLVWLLLTDPGRTPCAGSMFVLMSMLIRQPANPSANNQLSKTSSGSTSEDVRPSEDARLSADARPSAEARAATSARRARARFNKRSSDSSVALLERPGELRHGRREMVQRPRQSLAVQTQDLSPHFGIALGNPRKIAKTATREFTDAIGRIVKCIRIREGYEMREMAHPCDILVVISSGASLDSSAERAPKRLNPLNGRVTVTEVIRLNPIGIRDWSDDTGCTFKKVSTRMIRDRADGYPP